MSKTKINPVILTDDHKVEYDINEDWGFQFLQIDIPKSEISKKTINVLNGNLLGDSLSVWSLLLSENDFNCNLSKENQWRLVDGNWRTNISFYGSPFNRISKLSNNDLFNNVTMKIYYDTRSKLGYQRIRNGSSIERYFVSKSKPELFDTLKIQLEDWEHKWNSCYEGRPRKDNYPDFVNRVGRIDLRIKDRYLYPLPTIGNQLERKYDNELYVYLSTNHLNYMNYVVIDGNDKESIVNDQFSFDDLYESFDILKDLNINYRVDTQIKKNKEWGESDNQYMVDNPLKYYHGCVREWLVPNSENV
jgi:hypothetical protein